LFAARRGARIDADSQRATNVRPQRMRTWARTDRGTSYAGRVLLVAAAYFGAAELSLLLAIPPGYATALWPPSGIALAALMRLGTGVWPGILIGATLANFSIDGLPLASLAIGAGNTLEAYVAAALVARFVGTGYPFASGEAVVRFAGVVALAATVAATVGTTTVALAEPLPIGALPVNWLTWWQGDTSGMLIVTPLLLGWSVPRTMPWRRRQTLETALLGASTIAAEIVIFGGVLPHPPFALAFLVVPFVLWAAFRFAERDVATLVALACAIAVYYTVQRSGPAASASANAALMFLLAFNGALVMIGLIVSAVVRERARATLELARANDELELRIAERTHQLEQANAALRAEVAQRSQHDEQLRQSEERFRLLVDGIRDYAVLMLDPNGRVMSWNSGAQAISGYGADEIVGRHFSCLYTERDLERGWPQHELDVAREKGRFEDEGWRVRKDGSRYRANIVITPLYDSAHRLLGYAKVTRDLTLRRHYEALKRSEREVNVFLAMLAHELRNPLAPIVNALTLLANPAAGEQTSAESIAIIRRQIEHLTRIVDDLLDISRVTRGKITLRREALDLNAAVARAIEAARPLIDARGHRLDVQLAPAPLAVNGDPTRLVQVALNLLANAAKYTDPRGTITVATAAEGASAVLRVRDTGIGIPPDLLPYVFDLFVQDDRSLDRAQGGLGIGLTLVRRLLELHGGTVEASSDGRGRGSEFVVRLPRVDASAIAMQQASTAPAPARKARRVMIVDDNRDFANSLVTLLALSGHDARAIYDGASALAAAREFRPRVVLLDIGLPGASGYDVARQLRDAAELAPLTLVALTGYGRDEDRERVVAAGFDHHLVKPVDPDVLESIISEN
jgi:PAS domain S-box-containing protein